MNLDQALDDLRCKVDALDDMFDCPVCFERLSGNVPQCTQGHHLCRKCRARLSQCPVCQRKFNGTRNYFIEGMITKFEEMTCSLTNLTVKRFAMLISNEKPTGLSIIEEGKFPCGVEHCYKPLSFYDMIPHIEEVHNDEFTDVGPVQLNTYSDSWAVPHEKNSSPDEIFYIHNMGIFFVKIDVSQKGNVYGHVEMANSTSNAQYFRYKLEMGNDEFVQVFSGQVVSTKDIHNKSNYLSINNFMWKEDGDNWFKCNLTITCLR